MVTKISLHRGYVLLCELTLEIGGVFYVVKLWSVTLLISVN